MIVIDASALALAVADTGPRGRRARDLLDEGGVAPHLVDAEIGQALRGLLLRGELDEAAAERSLLAAEALVVERFPHPPLRGRAWQLLRTVSFYDGLYVALAERLGQALLTADAKLGRAQGPRCEIRVI